MEDEKISGFSFSEYIEYIKQIVMFMGNSERYAIINALDT